MADVPPSGTERVLVYCPTYPFMRVRVASVEVLEWTTDATHWHDYVTPFPAPPRDRG